MATKSKIKVGPGLFVTCRLCVEDLGEYHIVPSVQLQIKQFFDIDVEPFDGLPQLICTKCNEILCKIHTIKTTFCEKQTILRHMVITKDSQQDTVSSSHEAPGTTEPHHPANHIVKEPCKSKMKNSQRKRLLIHSSSSSDIQSEELFQTSKSQKKKSSRQKGKCSMPWEADYKRLISCKLCNSAWPSRRALAVHNRSHELLREQYKNIFNRNCTVNINKIDDKPNITGLNNMVVHSSNKIVEPGNSYFHTIYSKEDFARTNNSVSNCIQNEAENKCSSRATSVGEERIVFKPKLRKRRLSRRANESVIIESNSNKVSSDEECKSTARNNIDKPFNNNQFINIDDSSDSESDQGRLEKSGKIYPIEAKLADFKNFHGIISMCLNAYHKKNETAEVDMLYMNVNQKKKTDNLQVTNESQLKHKLLSIGRKNMNYQDFNCTGLLQYMEHKNLDIVWIDQEPSLHPKDKNNIRILTSLRGDLILDDEPAWVNISDISKTKRFKPLSLKKTIQIAVPNIPLSNVPVSSDSTAGKIATNKAANTETSQPEQINNQAKLDSMPAMLSYLLNSKATTSDSKLLNAYPVANPKQLPKKLGAYNESRFKKTVAQLGVMCLPTDDDNKYCLPIITSITSLATIASKEQIQDTNQQNASEEQIQDTNQQNAIKEQIQDTNQQNANKEQIQDTSQQNASKKQIQDTNKQNASKEQIQDTNKQNACTEQIQDTNQQNASKEQIQDTYQQNASEEQIQDTNQQNAIKEQIQDTNQQNANKEQIQDTNQQNASKEQIQDTNKQNASKEQIQDTNKQNASTEQIQDTNQQNASKEHIQDTYQQNASKGQIQETNRRNASNEYIQDTNQQYASREQIQNTHQKKNAASEEINNTEKPAPRIKVKPASELMSERTLDIMKEQSRNDSYHNMFVSQIEHAWPHQNSINLFLPNIAPQGQFASPALQMPTFNAGTAYQPMLGPITSNTTQNIGGTWAGARGHLSPADGSAETLIDLLMSI